MISAVLVSGCSHPPSKADRRKVAHPPKETAVGQRINLSAGHAEEFGEGAARPHLWSVGWDLAQVDVATPEGLRAGAMKGVRGVVYQKGVASSRFRSERGQADRRQKTLRLEGSVEVDSVDRGASLLCDRLEYLAGKQMFRATGDVRLRGRMGTVGTFSEVLATNDLKVVGTPDLFKRP